MEGTRLPGRHADTGYAHMQVEPDYRATFSVEHRVWFQKEGVRESNFKDHVCTLFVGHQYGEVAFKN